MSEYLKNVWRVLQQCAANPWFAYLTIVLLQMKRVWGAWHHRDITSGDTSSYFLLAISWAKGFFVDLLWSPLYTIFYGSVYSLVPDAYLATLLHRLVIVIVLSIMVLAVMRYLLPPYIAWLIAAWWVVLPINFDSLYEVHLFALILPLSAVLLVLYKPGMRTRGAALGVLLTSMMLVRNEIIIATGLWAVACLICEIRLIRMRLGEKVRVYLLTYGLPVLLAILATSFFYYRTPVISQNLLREKHTLNVCQVYSFGYQQRNIDWTKNPWTECQELMLRDFGQPFPSMSEAMWSNPPAMLKHLFWNIRLLPAGIQVALFNATSYHVSPDYAPVQLGRAIVLAPSILALILFFTGLVHLYRKKRYWWFTWIKARIWGWTMLFCLAAVMAVVVPMQRPRPSYMFLFTLLIMAIVGMCLFVLTRNIPFFRRFSSLVPVFMIALLIFTPSYYSTEKRPLLKLYNKLAPASEFLGIPETAIVMTDPNSQVLCNYFAKSIGTGFSTNDYYLLQFRRCEGYGYEIFKDLNKGMSVSELLDHQHMPVVALVVENKLLTDYGSIPSVHTFLSHPEQEGWKLFSVQDDSTGIWRLYINEVRLKVIDSKLSFTPDNWENTQK